jgi:hypothetical protein
MTYVSHDDDIAQLHGRCPLCSLSLQRIPKTDVERDLYYISCPACGTYGITKLVLSQRVLDFESSAKSLLSAIVRRHFVFSGKPELITFDNWQALLSQAPVKNDVSSKVRHLLRYIAHRSKFPGDKIVLTALIDYPICFAANKDEFDFYIRYAVSAGFVEEHDPGTHVECGVCLTTAGWEETRHIPTLESPYAFVAMSMWKESPRRELLDTAFDKAIEPAVQDSGYEKAIRIDREDFLGDVVFEIIARIKECRFVIADVTDQRHGVYFEGGYAMGMGLPVIWTCHKDDMGNAHFDTNHLNHIVWDDIAEFRKKLTNMILGTSIGRGPKGGSGL